MDDFDDERFSREILSAGPPARHARRAAEPPAEVGAREIRGSREQQTLTGSGKAQVVRVRGLDAPERGRLHDEVQLLASLEISQVSAAPSVLELEEDGYVRESAPARRHRSGRRAAEGCTPPTGEREALASARQALDQLLDELHAQGWVLGAPPGHGLGTRTDGTVVVIDLHGLRRDESLSARQADRRWVDSVLLDRDRTLRRRVHFAQPWSAADLLDPDGESGAAAAPPQTPGTADGAASMPALPADAAPSSAEPVPAASPALPSPRRLRRRAAQAADVDRPAAGDDAPTADAPADPRRASGAAGAVVGAVREVLRHPRQRRIAVVSGSLVLLASLMVAAGAWWAQERGVPLENAGPGASAPAPAETARPAPVIEDPRMLVAELAGTRHAYVTGVSPHPASAPDSPARAEADRLRAAYEGTTVSAGGPVVHSADVLAPGDTEGVVVLRAVTSMGELRLEDPSGTLTTIPESSPVTVDLTLRWDGEEWRIVSTETQDGSERT